MCWADRVVIYKFCVAQACCTDRRRGRAAPSQRWEHNSSTVPKPLLYDASCPPWNVVHVYKTINNNNNNDNISSLYKSILYSCKSQCLHTTIVHRGRAYPLQVWGHLNMTKNRSVQGGQTRNGSSYLQGLHNTVRGSCPGNIGSEVLTTHDALKTPEQWPT